METDPRPRASSSARHAVGVRVGNWLSVQQAQKLPKTSVVTTTERTFAIRDQSGKAEWVDVKKGVGERYLVEVIGNLKPGDRVVRRATDEIREGTQIQVAAKAK